MATTDDKRASRTHTILDSRLQQLQRNLMVLDGGGPYIEERLNRFSAESNSSWNGDTSRGIQSRKDRAFLINYAGRVATKITQYVFSQSVTREGADETFIRDTTKTGLSIDAFMKTIAKTYTAGRWAWIGVDRGTPETDPATGQPTTRSIAARKAAGDRIFWTHWRPDEVVDWCFNADGSIKWLLTQVDLYDNADPTEEPETRRVRTLWTDNGEGVRLYMTPGSDAEIEREEPFTISARVVPFALIGVPTAIPHWFDDVERIQASILNLESAHHENLIKTVFPQLVVPSDLITELQSMTDKPFEEALELVRGIDYPLLEPQESNGQTRFISPEDTDLGAIPKELTRRRGELFEVVGQALRGEDTKQVQSAASKAWDHRDIEATLADNADVLEDGEGKAVVLSKALDTGFKDYVPSYPRQFDLPDLENDWKILTEMENTGNLPESVLRAIAKVKVEVLDKIFHLDEATKQEAIDEIDGMEFEDLKAMVQAPIDRDAENEEDLEDEE
jgi:hypothetical protein